MRKFLSLVLALVMMMSLVTINAGAKEFSDDGDITYKEAVDVISTIKVVDGYADGGFKPGNNLTRGAAAKIICNMILGPTTAAELHADTAPYRDVPVTSDFAGYIAYCQKEGIISGYSDGSFRPAGTLTGYAFMKMLLGALGYDAEIEGYTGPNWSINVAKRAIGIGLNKSLEKTFNGVEYVTREEAALYAFNTLQADLVEYSQKITANVNGAEVTVGNSNATSRTWGSQATRYDNIRRDTIVQFAEEYFNKLVLERDVDSFGRPDREWSFDGDEIGAYINTDLLKQEYTTEVTGKDLYDLLGSNAIDEYLFQITIDGVDIDGKTGTSVHKTVLKDNAHSYFDEGHMNRNNKTGVGQTGKGVLTQVFVETGEGNTGKVWVAVINTYLAQATNDYSEKKDEVNLKVFALDSKYAGSNEVFFKFHDNDDGFAAAVDGENAKVRTILGEDFPEAVDMKKDDIFLVNVANGDVQIISDPEVLEEVTLTAFSKDNYVISDEQYDYNTTLEFDVETLEEYTLEGGGVTNLKDAVYNLYLDPYGYLIGVQLVEATKNYIFLTGIDQGNSNLNVRTSEAAGILTDGTFIEFKMNMLDSRTADDVNYISGTNKFVGHALWNTWCTYTVDKDGIYTLKEIGDFDSVFAPGDGVKAAKAGQFHDLSSNNKTIDTKRVSLIGKGTYDPGDGSLSATKYVYGNDDSVYMVAELKEVSAKNEIADDFPVPGDGVAAETGALTRVNDEVVIIGGVDSFGTGIDNISIKTFENAADINEKADDSSANGFPGWIYTLFDNDGYVIAAVVVGEDTGTTKNLVYSNTDSVKQEKYSKEDDEWTWTKEVIFNGEAIELVEKGSGLSKLKDMKANVWYEVTYKADETVKDVKYAYFTESGKKVGDTKAVDAALDHSFITADAAGEFVNHIEFIEETMTGDSSTVLYEEVWGAVTTRNEANDDDVTNSYGNVATGYGDGSAKTVLAEDNAPSLKGSTLYTDTNARMGFYVHKDVKSVLIQKNDGKSTTSYGTGTTDLERFLAELNFDESAALEADHSYLFKISAVLVDGRATAVIIHDWVEGDASKDDDHKTPGDEEEDPEGKTEIYVNFYTDVDAKTGAKDPKKAMPILKEASKSGRLTLEASDLTEYLPDGFVVDTAKTKLPLSLTVLGTGSGYAEVDVQVKADTKNLKLPEDYEITYTSEVDGGKADHVITTAEAASGVEIPTGAVVTVKVPAAVADHYVKIGTSYVSGGQTAEVTMTTAQDLSGIGTDKYYQVSATGAVCGAAVDGITFSYETLAAVYKKSTETVEISLTGAGTATTGAQSVTIGFTGSTGTTPTTTSTVETPAQGEAYTGGTITVSLGTPTDKDIVIAVTAA